MKLAIIDTLGLSYTGDTLSSQGLGGSESAVIKIAYELVQLGISVTVFNDCTSDGNQPGTYSGVIYRSVTEAMTTDEIFDVVITSRSLKVYKESWLVARQARHRVLWLHDTFCEYDELLEEYVVQGIIHDIFTLTDWHTSYITTCDHGRKRNFDVLKNHIFQTRNGICASPDRWIDNTQKDRNQFIFNASVTKGMVPLVEKVWPEVKKRIPDAKLTVIGGYYRFREDHGPDQQEYDWRDLVQRNTDITFTGVITQQEISSMLRTAGFMIYPTAFPETFGISTLEAIAHNVPVITCQFGGLEETAIDMASYKIPYTVEPNWSVSWLDESSQVQRFVDLVEYAYHNTYLYQQKQYACNQVKDICTWDTIALQWKQHLVYKSGGFLSIEEYKKVSVINEKVRKVFGRRFINEVEYRHPKTPLYNMINVVTPVYNAENYINKCIESVSAQDYNNYRMFIIDDSSTDNTWQVAKDTIDALPDSIRERFILKRNDVNVGALANQIRVIEGVSGICVLLDGDDWLINKPDVFDRINTLYNNGAEFTYGSCWSVVDNIPLIAQEYPPEVKAQKQYRTYKFNWNMPYTHLRTFKADLFHTVIHDKGYFPFKDGNLEYLKAGGDTALFYELIEVADPDKVVCVNEILYNYNDANPICDYKINSEEQTRNASRVLNSVFPNGLTDLRPL